MPPASPTALHFGQALLPQGWAQGVRVTLKQGCITAVTPDSPALPGDERHAIGLPGLPNLHSHAFQRGMAGLAETSGTGPDSFWTWRAVMYRFLDRLDPDAVRIIATLAYAEMLEAGFTRVGEFHYLHHAADGTAYDDPGAMIAAVAEAAQVTGIGLTLLPVFYAYSGFGGQAPLPQQRRFIHTLDSFTELRGGAVTLVAPLEDAVVGTAAHSLRAVTPAQLAALTDQAGTAPFHIHVAEQQREVADCLAWSGQRPVQWLLDHAEPDANWCLVHATHVDSTEIAGLAASGAVAGLCPITEANLGDGLFPAEAYLAAGGCYGLGSDSNVLISAAEELRLLEYGQRLTRQGRNLLAAAPGMSTGGSMLRAALRGGGQALGVTASLASGHSADLLSLNAAHPALAGRSGDSLIDGWIFAARDNPVDCVWRRGRKVVSGGRHHAREAAQRAYLTLLPGLFA